MEQKYNLTVEDVKFEDRVYLMADEMLNILKELSQEKKGNVNTKEIADKMLWRDSVKKMLSGTSDVETKDDREHDKLKKLSSTFLDKLTDIVPSFLNDEFKELREDLKHSTDGSTEWLDSPINVIKKYIHSLSTRIDNLEDFMQQTMQYLTETEAHISDELSSNQNQFNDNRTFEQSVSENVSMIGNCINVSQNLNSAKNDVVKRINSINQMVEKKKEQDSIRLKENEKALETLGCKMKEIKNEADEIKRKADQIEFESVRDPLTGLFNRKAYDQKMTETLAHVDRYDIKSSLLVCDIDFFKKINDTFGHSIGDLALKKLADLLNKRLRANDFISRYGGEEFTVILPHTDISGAEIAAEGIRSYIAEAVFTYKEEKIPLTISVGVSVFNKGDSATSVFERADKALYLAKKSGRNMVKTQNDVKHNENNSNLQTS